MNIYKKMYFAILLFLFGSISYQSIGYSATYQFVNAPNITNFRDEQIRSYILRHSNSVVDFAVIHCIEKKYSYENSLIIKDLKIKLTLPKEGFLAEGYKFEYGDESHAGNYTVAYNFNAKSIYEDIDSDWVSREGYVKITKIKQYRGKLYKVSGEFNLKLELLPLYDNDFVTTGRFKVIISSRKTLSGKKTKAISLDPSS